MNVFEPIDFDFDQKQLLTDLLEMDVFNKSHLATVIYNNGRSKYDKDEFFDEYADVLHYNEDGELIEGKYKTFVTYNFTHIPGISETENDSFVDTPEGKRPIWHVYNCPWVWKESTPQSLIDTVKGLGLKYVSCVRLVGQVPPSKGIVHVDSDFKENLRYLKKGGVNITLNVSDGGGHLQYRYQDEMHTIDESKYKCWHFNDSLQHRTTEITSPRVQIRIFGKK
jgi:hypothetical protein